MFQSFGTEAVERTVPLPPEEKIIQSLVDKHFHFSLYYSWPRSFLCHLQLCYFSFWCVVFIVTICLFFANKVQNFLFFIPDMMSSFWSNLTKKTRFEEQLFYFKLTEDWNLLYFGKNNNHGRKEGYILISKSGILEILIICKHYLSYASHGKLPFQLSKLYHSCKILFAKSFFILYCTIFIQTWLISLRFAFIINILVMTKIWHNFHFSDPLDKKYLYDVKNFTMTCPYSTSSSQNKIYFSSVN